MQQVVIAHHRVGVIELLAELLLQLGIFLLVLVRYSASPSVLTCLNDSIACANVPTKVPTANWLGLCKMVATMRGEN
jgi:hypothetical protein